MPRLKAFRIVLGRADQGLGGFKNGSKQSEKKFVGFEEIDQKPSAQRLRTFLDD